MGIPGTGRVVPHDRGFDPLDGHKFVRFCFAGSEADMRDAIRALEAWRK